MEERIKTKQSLTVPEDEVDKLLAESRKALKQFVRLKREKEYAASRSEDEQRPRERIYDDKFQPQALTKSIKNLEKTTGLSRDLKIYNIHISV